GTEIPDLSVISRARGADWIYSYLKGFYLDPSRPYGVNNTVFPDVGMPHVLWELQGWQTKHESHGSEDGHGEGPMLTLDQAGSQTPAEYDQTVRDITNFLVYLGEPAQQSRKSIECHRTRIVLREKDITVDIIDIDPENKPEDLLDLNPYNSVPTLVDRDLVLYEPRIIMEYLDERFPHPPLMPVDPVSRARTRLALYRVERDWYGLLDDLQFGGEKKAARARKILKEALIGASDVFAAKPFFLRDEFSLVDATIAPIL
ncbi:unnamed protein product, partial [Cyprideis torosa]